MIVAARVGDDAGVALGLGALTGDVVVSIGTSGTVFAATDAPVADSTGTVAGFADASGLSLSLVAARVLSPWRREQPRGRDQHHSTQAT